jgi:hypothetical protein
MTTPFKGTTMKKLIEITVHEQSLGDHFRKIFQAEWGEGYVKAGSALLTFDDITEENGWFDWCIEKLEDARVGQTVDCSCISGVLHVTRIQ